MLYKLKSLTEKVVSPLPLFKSAFSLAVLTAALLNAGCVPKDAKNTASAATEASIVYSGFAGLTAAQTMSSTKVRLTWTQSTDPTVKAYNIYDTSLLFSPKLIKTVLAPSSEVTILNLLPANLYSFRVRAINGSNVEDTNKVDLNAIPYAGVTSAAVDSATAATVTFPDASNADAARVYCQISPSTDWTLLATIQNPTATTLTKQLTGLVAGSVYTCRVALSINGYEDNNTVTVSFTPVGTAAQLLFTTQPGSAPAGQALSQQPVVTIKDINGTVVAAGADSNVAITLVVSAASPSNGTVRGTATVNAVKGVATFTNLFLNEAGIKILTASKADTSAQPTGSQALTVDSSQFTISSGTVSASYSSIAISPAVPPNAALVANGSNAYQVIITLKDGNGNPIAGIKPTFVSNISGDTLTQPTAVTNSSGVTTGSISTTIADTTPARTLSIASPSGLNSLTVLAPFVPGAASKLAFTAQPVNSPSGPNGLSVIKVAVEDAQGNVITTGSDAASSISMAIAANTNNAVLTGTTPIVASAGVSTFQDLGISKTQTGYKLLATSGSLTPAYSNSFNVTAGTPQKIVVTTTNSEVLSGSCSGAITIQLQDSGGNPANAIQNTPVTLSGLGTGALYASSTCAGTALTSSTTFTAGTSSKTVYFKDAKAEALTFTVSDPSNVLTQGTLPLYSAADKISLLAQAAPPAANGTLLSVPAGRCSSAIVITPMGDNNVAGPLFTTTTITVTGITGTSATLYTDSSCSTPVAATSVMLLANLSGNYTTNLYIKDPVSETLSLSLADPSGKLTTTSTTQTVQVGASKLDFTGPTSVVSGACSTAFTLKMKDTLGNNVTPTTATTLTINGLSTGATGVFYTSSSCSGTPSNSSVTFPANVSQMQIFYKDTAAETVTVSISDPVNMLTTSQSITLGVSPSALSITGPSGGTAKTTVCSGPFYVKTLDGAGNNTAAITPITVTMSGAGSGGGYFIDTACTAAGSVSSFTFAQGDKSKTFYFQGEFPQTSLTMTATDNAGVLTAGTMAWAITAAPGFLGSAGSLTDANGNLYWFQKGFAPVAGRMNAQQGARALYIDQAKQYLYIMDRSQGRILKFDYTNRKYIGWLGAFTNAGGIGVSGSNLSTPSTASCAATTSGNPVPGWCVGGQSYQDGNITTGKMYSPVSMTDDGTYIYVAMMDGYAVSRYVAATGAFAGWIGNLSARPTASGAGNSNSCTAVSSGPTPGWCIGGSNTNVNQPTTGTGYVNYPRAVTNDGTYLYVGNAGGVNRYLLADGSFQGWVGWIGTTSPTMTGACAGQGTGAITSGWCTGGGYTAQNTRSNPGAFNYGFGMFINNGILYTVNGDSGATITMVTLSTGQSQGIMPGMTGFSSANQAVTDGSLIYIADNIRLVKVDYTGVVQGWVGKVANNNSMSGACSSSTAVNSDTPGWCIGGTAKNGMEEGAFHQLTAVALDGNGNILTGQADNFPSVKIFDKGSGVYNGSLAQQSTSPQKWSNDATAVAGYYGFDDYSFNQPTGSWVDSAGTYLYVTEYEAARVKKINTKTGAVVGWIGAITTVPTGGVNTSTCLTATPNAGSPGWCLGALYQPGYMGSTFTTSYNVDGVFNRPVSVVGDDSGYLYVSDIAANRILKFNASTGAFVGWIGLVGTSPTGGPSTCTGTAAGTFTPGWCTGGGAQAGSGDGALNAPGGITYTNGVLYVMDTNNHRVSSYDSSSGAFKGWIGRINSGTPTGCTSLYNNQYYYSGGWCKGGTSLYGNQGGDRGGTFYMYQSGSRISGITTDGTYLYIPNFWNVRIDKWSLAGYFIGAVSARTNNFTNTWVNISNPTAPSATDTQRDAIGSFSGGTDYPLNIWADSTNIYGTTDWFSAGGNAVTWKLTKSTGTMVGWQGGVSFSNPPTGGATGCAGATGTTPGWCQGGYNNYGLTLGYFTDAANGIAGDGSFVYVSDSNSNRVTRIPK